MTTQPSLLDIIIAVKESQPVSEADLRLALLAQTSIEYFIEKELQDLIEAVLAGKPSASMRAEFANGTLERMFKARKKPPAEWLGPTNTPGNPEYERRYAMGKKLIEKVLGPEAL